MLADIRSLEVDASIRMRGIVVELDLHGDGLSGNNCGEIAFHPFGHRMGYREECARIGDYSEKGSSTRF